MACCKNSTPSMRGMRWSARSKATLSLRIFNCFKRSSAPSGESLPITRYSAPYCERRSRSIARRTSESSSTLSNMGLAMLGLGFAQRHDYRSLPCVHDLIRYRNLNMVAQIPVAGNMNRLSERLIQKGCFSVVCRERGRTGNSPGDSKQTATERTSGDEVDLGEHRAPARNNMARE